MAPTLRSSRPDRAGPDRDPDRRRRRPRRRLAVAVLAAALGAAGAIVGTGVASATNAVGPGYGLDGSGHNDGAYSITTAAGGQVLGFCVTPGGAGPEDIPSDVYQPVAAAPDGPLAELGYLAAVGQGGLSGYGQNDVDAAVALLAYQAAGGQPPAGDPQPPGPLLQQLADDMTAYPGPWTLTADPPAGAPYRAGQTYSGSLTLTAADHDPVPGIAVAPPATGGSGQWTAFSWVGSSGVTDADGRVAYQFSQGGPGAFSETFALPGGAPGAAPAEFAAPAGSDGQSMLGAQAGASPVATVGGTTTQESPAAVEVQKSDDDPAYVGIPAGVVFDVVNSSGADPAVAAGAVIITLTTAAGGRAGPSAPLLPAGGYSVREQSVPAGSGLGLDATPVPFTVTPAQTAAASPATVVVAVSDRVLRGALSIVKVDSDSGGGLAGAAFTVSYDAGGDGTFAQPVDGPGPGGTFVTGADGRAADPAGVLGALLPGRYRVTETTAPAGHAPSAPASRVVTVAPGGQGNPLVVTFADITVPAITTVASPGGPVGTGLTDTARFTGSAHAGGTIVFRAYGPFASAAAVACTPATLADTSAPVPVHGSGSYPMGVTFTPPAPGLYTWVETYSGDTNNQPAVGQCGATGETSTVTPAPAVTPPSPASAPSTPAPSIPASAPVAVAPAVPAAVLVPAAPVTG